jgi:hypothetical protein
LKGDRRPLLAFITELTSRFSPIAPICVGESYVVEDGVDIGSVYCSRRQTANHGHPTQGAEARSFCKGKVNDVNSARRLLFIEGRMMAMSLLETKVQ